MKVYVLVVTTFLNSSIAGIYSKRDDAEKQKSRIEKITKSPAVFSMSKCDILEVPFDSTELVDEGIEQFKKELGLE